MEHGTKDVCIGSWWVERGRHVESELDGVLGVPGRGRRTWMMVYILIQ